MSYSDQSMAISTRAGGRSRCSGMGLPEVRPLCGGLSSEGPRIEEPLKGESMERIYELHADVCKIFSSPKRLEILNALKDKERSAGELIEKIGLSKANLSQHMSILKTKGMFAFLSRI